jgi:hypothetical protein
MSAATPPLSQDTDSADADLATPLDAAAALRKSLPPRELDRYPDSVLIDWRVCSVETLEKFARHFRLRNVGPNLGRAELARLVASHYEEQLEVNEDEVIPQFVEYLMAIEGLPVHETDERRYAKRLRRASRKPGSISSDEEDPSTQVYCICKHIGFGEMIACDDENCEIEWYHVGCVGLKPGEMNRGTWYCPKCTERRKAEVTVTRGGRGVKKRSAPRD